MGHMGLDLEGAGPTERTRRVDAAIGDLRRVVEAYLGGVVAGRAGGAWVAAADFAALDASTRERGLLIQAYFPADYRERELAAWELAAAPRPDEGGERARRRERGGATPEPAGAARAGGVPSAADTFAGLPLHRRVREMLTRRGVTQKELAGRFGVAPSLVTAWLKGVGPDAGGGAKPIPARYHWALIDWIEADRWPGEDWLAERRRPGGGTG